MKKIFNIPSEHFIYYTESEERQIDEEAQQAANNPRDYVQFTGLEFDPEDISEPARKYRITLDPSRIVAIEESLEVEDTCLIITEGGMYHVAGEYDFIHAVVFGEQVD